MFHTLGLSAEQVYGDVYASWLRDTFEKHSSDTYAMFRDFVENGFRDRQIVLRRARVGVHVMSSLATMLHRSALTRLDLYGNTLRDGGCDVLAHALRDLPHLLYLDVGANDMTGQGGCLQALGQSVAQHRKLSALLLGSARGDPYANRIGAAAMTTLLDGCTRSRSLRQLDLGGNPFAADTGATVEDADRDNSGDGGDGGDGVKHVGADAATATVVTGSGASGDASAVAIAVVPATTTTAVRRRHPVDVLEQLLRTSNTLTSLKLKDVGLTAHGALQLLRALETNSTLALLDVSCNALPSRVAGALGQLLHGRSSAHNSCALQTLALSGNDLFAPAVATTPLATLSDGGSGSGSGNSSRNSNHGDVSSSSTSSSLHNTQHHQQQQLYTMTGSATAHAADAAAAAPLPLPSLAGSSGAAMTCAPASATTALTTHAAATAASVHAPQYALLLALANDRVVTTLQLDRCGFDDTAMQMLCRSLLSNHALQTLSLRDNAVTARGAVSLGRALCQHPCLRRLYLAGNAIGDEGVCALAYVVQDRHHTLEVLDVQRAHMGDRGLVALGVALHDNTTMHVLLLSDNHITRDGGDAFAALLEQNTSVVQCQLRATSVSHPTLRRIADVVARNTRTIANAEPDALRREVIRLHYQKYKLEEARLELEALRDKNAEAKRAVEAAELQSKQDQTDFARRLRELQEQLENYTTQEAHYRAQQEKLRDEFAHATAAFDEDMQLAHDRLAVEVAQREKLTDEYAAVERELHAWRHDGDAREQQKRQQLASVCADAARWAAQRKEYHEKLTTATQTLQVLEARLAQQQQRQQQQQQQKQQQQKQQRRSSARRSSSRKRSSAASNGSPDGAATTTTTTANVDGGSNDAAKEATTTTTTATTNVAA